MPRQLQATPLAAKATNRSSRLQRACAYCGEAHQRRWRVADGPLPEIVELPVGTGTRPYRLVRHPRTGVPARDAQGALVFIPVRESDLSW
jgi:hypothetical protein